MREHIDRSRDSPGTDAGCGGGGGGDGAGGGGNDEAGDDPDPGKFTDLKLCARENFERGFGSPNTSAARAGTTSWAP